MPAEGLLKNQGELFIWGPMEPHQSIAFNIMTGLIIEKMIVVYCLPTDSAVDVYAFDDREEIVEIVGAERQTPYLRDENRIHRVGWRESLNTEVWSNGKGNARLSVRHIPGKFAQSPN